MTTPKNYVVWKIVWFEATQFLIQIKPYSKFGKFEDAQKFTHKQAIKVAHSFRKDGGTGIRYGYDRMDQGD